jgi:ketosteroid isomerase-like protein
MLAKKKLSPFAILLFSISIAFISCDLQNQTTKVSSTNDIMNADMAFSDMSRQVGMKKAFLQYIDNEGTLLRPGHLPIVGADAIDYLSKLSDTAYSLSWKPTHAEISKSGDLGYTYGTYQLKLEGNTLTGTYVNIWKKENGGEWRFVLNSDNPGD